MKARKVVLVVAATGCAVQVANAQAPDLWRAIQRGELAAVEAHLRGGGDPNGRAAPRARAAAPQSEEPPWPLLRIALYDREEDIALALLEAGADFEALDESLDLAAGQGMPRVLRYLIAQRPSRLRNAPRIVQDGVLQNAVQYGYHQSVEARFRKADASAFHGIPER